MPVPNHWLEGGYIKAVATRGSHYCNGCHSYIEVRQALVAIPTTNSLGDRYLTFVHDNVHCVREQTRMMKGA